LVNLDHFVSPFDAPLSDIKLKRSTVNFVSTQKKRRI